MGSRRRAAVEVIALPYGEVAGPVAAILLLLIRCRRFRVPRSKEGDYRYAIITRFARFDPEATTAN